MEGEPQGKGRPRFGQGRTYTPKKTLEYEKLVALAAHQAGLEFTLAPVSIRITAIHKRPKRLKRRKDSRSRIIKTTKPDIDNIVKAVLDGLKGCFDDKQVYSLQSNKYYSAWNEKPRVEVFVTLAITEEEIEEQDTLPF